MAQNRRKFSRVPFSCEASFFLPDGEYGVEVVDLSLKGALIHPNNASMFVTVGTSGTLKIPLDGGGTSIRMEAAVVHHLGNHYGLLCRDIDIDSMTHLRALLKMNLGDEGLAEREFAQLTLPA